MAAHTLAATVTAVRMRAPAREREVLEMRAQNMTNRAIADALGIKLSTVKTLVRRARQRLGAELPARWAW